MDDRLLTTRELQDFLRLDRITIYRMVQAGQIPAMKVGCQWRFSQAAVEDWLKSHRSRPTLPIPEPLAPSEALAIAARPLAALRVIDLVGPSCLETIQDSFAQALGMCVGITDLEGMPIVHLGKGCAFCEYGWSSSIFLQRCQEWRAALANGAEPTSSVRICHAGIRLSAVPVLVHHQRLGLVLAGPLLSIVPGPDFRRRLHHLARECDLHESRLLSEAGTIRVLDQERIRVVTRLLVVVGTAISEIATQNYQAREKLAKIAQIVKAD